MKKRRENNRKEDKKKEAISLSFGKYTENFEHLRKGKRRIEDLKSDRNSFIPVEIMDEEVYLAEPDRNLIPDIQNQQKCDFLLYCLNAKQVCFIELKGKNIPNKTKYNPYDQIIDTIKFLKSSDDLKEIVSVNIEKHAFIVSYGCQKIPNGIETKERALWQQLVQNKEKSGDLIHYVKVTKSERYSNNNRKIICSSSSPIPIPFCEKNC